MAQIELSQMCSSCRGKFVFAFSFDEQLQKNGTEGIVIAELCFHLAQRGTPGGTGYSGTSSLVSDCRLDCVQMQGRYREPE